MNEKKLFRTKALESKADKGKIYGNIVLYFPQNYIYWLFFLITLITIPLSIILFSSYTKKIQVNGELLSTKGFINLHSEYNGIITDFYIKDGQEVNIKQPLFKIVSNSELQKKIGEKFFFFSPIKDFSNVQNLIPIDFKKEAKNLNKYNSSYIGSYFIAPIEGNFFYAKDFNQNFKNSNIYKDQIIAIITPSNSIIKAKLFIPMSHINSIKKGDKVYLKYTNLPYKNFNKNYGEITEILEKPIIVNNSHKKNNKELMIELNVSIPQKSFISNNKSYFLIPGMKVEAEIILGQKKVYQWLGEILKFKGLA